MSEVLLGVISDSHGHVPFTLEAIRVLRQFQIAAVLHCGDIGSPEVIRALAEWPTHYVFGNCDRGLEGPLRQAMQAVGHVCHERFGKLSLAGLEIAWLHGDSSRDLAEAIAGGDYHVVCSGHTHAAAQHWQADTLALNPGALYRANPRSLALIELPQRRATILPLS
jgi:hypothetical protein